MRLGSGRAAPRRSLSGIGRHYRRRRTFPTRITNPATSARVMIMQRTHQADLSGHVLETGGWTHLKLPTRFVVNKRCTTIYAEGTKTLVGPTQEGRRAPEPRPVGRGRDRPRGEAAPDVRLLLSEHGALTRLVIIGFPPYIGFPDMRLGSGRAAPRRSLSGCSLWMN